MENGCSTTQPGRKRNGRSGTAGYDLKSLKSDSRHELHVPQVRPNGGVDEGEALHAVLDGREQVVGRKREAALCGTDRRCRFDADVGEGFEIAFGMAARDAGGPTVHGVRSCAVPGDDLARPALRRPTSPPPTVPSRMRRDDARVVAGLTNFAFLTRDFCEVETAQPRAGAPRSAMILSATRQALAMMVRVGLAPVPVGNGEPSTT